MSLEIFYFLLEKLPAGKLNEVIKLLVITTFFVPAKSTGQDSWVAL